MPPPALVVLNPSLAERLAAMFRSLFAILPPAPQIECLLLPRTWPVPLRPVPPAPPARPLHSAGSACTAGILVAPPPPRYERKRRSAAADDVPGKMAGSKCASNAPLTQIVHRPAHRG